ncbi:MAG: PilW family protein [Chitinivibrionales bacterium]
MNNKGLTLVELVIYVAMVGIVSILILSQMKMINLNFDSGRKISGLQSESRDVTAMLAREIRNTGFKTIYNPSGSNTLSKITVPGTFISSDSSSFVHKEGTPSDTLEIYKARIDNAGIIEAVDTILYYLDGTVLKRERATDTIVLASNVQALQFQYGVFDKQATMISETTIVVGNWVASNCVASAAGGEMEITVGGATTGDVRHVSPISLPEPRRVLLDFTLAAKNGFPAGLDYVQWAVRSSGGALLTAERFLAADGANRVVLPVPSVSNGSLSLTFKSSGAGKLLLKSVVMKQADLGKYVWKDTPSANEKKAVKAIRICLLTRSSAETNMRIQTPVTVGNITVSRSGAYTWRQYVETVEVPNNGLF